MSDAKRIAEIRQVYGELSTFEYGGLSPIEAALVDLLACVDALVARNVELKINEAWRLDRLDKAQAVAAVAKEVRASAAYCKRDDTFIVNDHVFGRLSKALDAHVAAEKDATS